MKCLSWNLVTNRWLLFGVIYRCCLLIHVQIKDILDWTLINIVVRIIWRLDFIDSDFLMQVVVFGIVLSHFHLVLLLLPLCESIRLADFP